MIVKRKQQINGTHHKNDRNNKNQPNRGLNTHFLHHPSCDWVSFLTQIGDLNGCRIAIQKLRYYD
jgi:hypothetical protein